MTARTSPPPRRCVVCGLVYPGDLVALMPIGPGTNAGAREHARRGEAYAPQEIAVCRACAFGDELEDETDRSTRGGEPPRTVPREPMK